jgi:ethanolamine utilization protein EutM
MAGLVKGKSLGLIETVGLVGAIEACDTAAKTADVIISSAEITDAALVSLKIWGELGAVQAAVQAGSQAAARVGQLLAAHVIPNPDEELDVIMGNNFKPGTNIFKNISSPPQSSHIEGDAEVQLANIDKMSVTMLRSYARTIPNLAIKGREISKADKETLLREIRKAMGDNA